jgi:hypothetical protein
MAIDDVGLLMLGAVHVVPGILGLKTDRSPAGPFPMPLRRGPVCERCWLGDGQVRAVAQLGCRHKAVRDAH